MSDPLPTKIVTRIVGEHMHKKPPIWPKDMPLPRVGDDVTLGDEEIILFVRSISFYPQGADGDPQPLIYMVLGPQPR